MAESDDAPQSRPNDGRRSESCHDVVPHEVDQSVIGSGYRLAYAERQPRSPQVAEVRTSIATWSPTHAQEQARLLARLRDDSATAAWTLADFQLYLSRYKKNGPETVRKRIQQLELMERHHVAPVQLHAGRAELVESFSMYVAAREEIDECRPGALINDHKAIRSLGNFLGIPEGIWPTSPTEPAREPRWVPSPEEVSAMLRTTYGSQRGPENRLIRYMLAFSFAFGVRCPSELAILTLDDVDLAHAIVRIVEPKKSGRIRKVVVEPRWLVDGRRRMSLKHWIDDWRPRLHPTTSALFPHPSGANWPSKEALRKFLGVTVRDHFPWYYPYIGRHWSCNARLIDGADRTGRRPIYDWNEVARWHGHESVKMTMNTYGPAVEVHERMYGSGRVERAFSPASSETEGR